MGSRNACALAWLLAATLSALLLQAPSARGDELLVNGGFEDELSGEWTVVTDGDVLERVHAPEPVHSGGYAGALTCQAYLPCALQQVAYHVGYGQEYEVKVCLLWNESEILGVSAHVDWLDEQGSGIQSVEAQHPCTLPTDEPYRCFSTGLHKAPATAHSAKVGVVVVLTNGAETSVVYLDDFSFTGPLAPTPTPAPTLSPTPPPTVSPSPTAVPTATQVPTPKPSPASPSPTATSRPATPLPGAGLVNGGFEDADGGGEPLGWQKYGGELSRSSTVRRDGQHAAAFTSRTASTKWAFQTVAVQGGEAYVLSGYALKNDANVAAAYLRLSWYASPDGSGKAIDSVDSTMRLTDDSLSFRFLSTGAVVAPSRAASAKVRLMLDPLSEAEGTVYFDDVSFDGATMAPEPEETPQPSPSAASSESPMASPVAPVAAVEEIKPSSLPDALPPRPSPTLLGAMPSSPEATAFSRNGSSQSEADPKGSPAQTPVVLYRERRPGQSIQGENSVTAGGDEGNGLSPIALALAAVPPAATAAATAFFGWQRWKKRARPP